jgi:hypothetical protein
MTAIERLSKYAGLDKDKDRCPSNPCITVRDAIEIADEITTLRAKLEVAEKDAARYRAKREIDYLKSVTNKFATCEAWEDIRQAFNMSYDAAIDAELAKEKK